VAPPPISGGTLIALKSGHVAVASDPDRDAIYVVDTSSATLLSTITLQAGDEPGRLAEDGAGRVHVALRSGGALVTVDPMAGTVLARRDICPAARGVAWDQTTDRVWVACATGELVALPAAGGAATTRWVIERDLRDVLVRNGALSVTKFRSAEILRISSNGTIVRRDAPSSFPIFRRQVLWRAVQLSTNQTLLVHQDHSTMPIGIQQLGAYGGQLGAIESRCTMMDDDTGSEDRTVPLFGAPIFGQTAVLPVDVALSPDGTYAVVLAAGSGFSPMLAELHIVSIWTSKSSLTPILSIGPPMACSPPSTSGSASGGDSGAAGTAAGSASLAVDAGAPLGIDATAPSSGPTPGPAMSATPSPTASSPPTMSPAPTTSPFVPEQPIAVAFDGLGHVLVQTREPAALRILDSAALCVRPLIRLSGGKVVTLSTVSRDDTGHDIFHAAAGAAIACASCHPEGGDDGHVWILDGFARRTPSLRGTIAGTAPYHWPGDQKDFVALAADVYTGRMGGAMLAVDQMNALMGWVQTIPAPPAPSWVDAAAAQRGKAVFERSDSACATCHSGTKLTNNQTLNVGTCGAFQVPPLVGVGWRTPLMHNGCAATIGDRFGKCATQGHGLLHALSPADTADLTAYLETL
jgi:hypothetical protein